MFRSILRELRVTLGVGERCYMLKSVRRQRVVDQTQVQTVDPRPEKNGKNDLPAEIEAEEAGMKLGEVYQWHHEPTADNRYHGATRESSGEMPPFGLPPR